MSKSSQDLTEFIDKIIEVVRPKYVNAQDDELKLVLSKVIGDLNRLREMAVTLQLEFIETQKKVEKIEEWNQKKMEYTPFQFLSGCWIVISKKSEKSPYAKEWYFKSCYDNGEISTLQPELKSIRYSCPKHPKSVWISDEDDALLREARGLPPIPPIEPSPNRMVW